MLHNYGIGLENEKFKNMGVSNNLYSLRDMLYAEAANFLRNKCSIFCRINVGSKIR